MSYALGAVKPFVQDVADTVGPMLAPAAIYGWRAIATDMQGHPAGLALDWSVGDDKAKGQRIADYFQQNAAGLQVRYLIWQQRLWRPGSSTWEPMATRPASGSNDANHLRHVHVSFNTAVSDGRRLSAANAPAAGTSSSSGGSAVETVVSALTPDPVEQGARFLAMLGDRRTWVRVLQVIGGSAAIVMGVALLTRDSASATVGSVTQLVPHPAAQAVGAVARASDNAGKSVTKTVQSAADAVKATAPTGGAK